MSSTAVTWNSSCRIRRTGEQLNLAAACGDALGHLFVDRSGACQRVGKAIDQRGMCVIARGDSTRFTASPSENFLMRCAAKSASKSVHDMPHSFSL